MKEAIESTGDKTLKSTSESLSLSPCSEEWLREPNESNFLLKCDERFLVTFLCELPPDDDVDVGVIEVKPFRSAENVLRKLWDCWCCPML